MDEPDDRAAGHRLAGAGLTDQRERLAGPHVEADAADRVDRPAPRWNLDPEVLDRQEWGAHGRFARDSPRLRLANRSTPFGLWFDLCPSGGGRLTDLSRGGDRRRRHRAE